MLQTEDLISVVIYMFCTTETGNKSAWLARSPEQGHCTESQDKRSFRRAGVCATAASLWERCCIFGWYKTIATSSCGGPWMGEVIPKDAWEIGSISSKPRTESPKLAALPKKTSDEHQPQQAGTAEPQGMAQPEPVAFWCFVTLVPMSHWRHPKQELSVRPSYACKHALLSPVRMSLLHGTLATNRGHPLCKLLFQQNVSKDEIVQRRAWSGWWFLSEFGHQKKGRGCEPFWFNYWASLRYSMIHLTALPLLPPCGK